jgi:hypothetical protein
MAQTRSVAFAPAAGLAPQGIPCSMTAGRPEWSLVGPALRLDADERKVRTPQSNVPRESAEVFGASRGNGKCHRKHTTLRSFGDGGPG